MKPFCIFIVLFLLAGICSVTAQDLIVLKNGDMIEAKIMEISPSEIRYKRIDNLDGPMIIIPKVNVLSIRYENGTTEIINTAGQESIPADNTRTTALNPDRLTFAFNANAGGALLAGTSMRGSGPSVCFEFSKGKFNTEVNLIIPVGSSLGFGGLATFNYFWHSQIGGFYLGGGLGYIYSTYTSSDLWDLSDGWTDERPPPPTSGTVTGNNFTFGLNVGYKFVTKSGVYFRAGTYVGMSIIVENTDNKDICWLQDKNGHDFYTNNNDPKLSVYFKPDLTIGYAFKGK
ncbi:MAG: hypothetical protein LBH20_05770 [Treponema sp.]|jgi:hypothetical protein|nr:hypothetical protein [Treponema sp.]